MRPALGIAAGRVGQTLTLALTLTLTTDPHPHPDPDSNPDPDPDPNQAEMGSSIVLTHWGSHTGLDGTAKVRCFDAARDLVIPAASRAPPRSPHWPTHLVAAAAAAAAAATAVTAVTAVGAAGTASSAAMPEVLPSQPPVAVPRTTQLFFSGALCWSRATLRARDWGALDRKLAPTPTLTPTPTPTPTPSLNPTPKAGSGIRDPRTGALGTGNLGGHPTLALTLTLHLTLTLTLILTLR